MPFKFLKYLIAHLKRTTPCQKCGSKCDDDFINVLAATFNPETAEAAGLFAILCAGCHSHALISISCSSVTAKLRKGMMHINSKSEKSGISANDILDMRNFLKNWNGADINELFNKS